MVTRVLDGPAGSALGPPMRLIVPGSKNLNASHETFDISAFCYFACIIRHLQKLDVYAIHLDSEPERGTNSAYCSLAIPPAANISRPYSTGGLCAASNRSKHYEN
jgi:hypothetical protein